MRRSRAQPGGSSRALRSRARTRPRRAGGAGLRLRARMRRDPAAGRGHDVSPSHLNYTIGDRLQRETSEPDGEPAEHRARIPGRALEVASHRGSFTVKGKLDSTMWPSTERTRKVTV